MKVLVTGATGFIGSHVVPELLAHRCQVRVLARGSSDVSSLPGGIEAVRGGLEEARAAMDGMDGLVHLAGVGGGLLHRSDPHGREIRRVNVEGTRKVFEAAHDAGVKRAVLVTSMWTVLRPDLGKTSPYVASRIDSEAAALDAARGRPETVILCPTFVVGKGDRGPNFPGSLVLAALRGRMRLAPPGGMTWIAVQDTAHAIGAALSRGVPGMRYVIGAEFFPHLELFSRVADRGGVGRPLLALPRGLLLAGAEAGDLALRLIRRHAAVPPRAGVELLCLDSPIDCSRSWKDLAEPAVPVDEAIGDAIAWFRENGYAPAGRHPVSA